MSDASVNQWTDRVGPVYCPTHLYRVLSNNRDEFRHYKLSSSVTCIQRTVVKKSPLYIEWLSTYIWDTFRLLHWDERFLRERQIFHYEIMDINLADLRISLIEFPDKWSIHRTSLGIKLVWLSNIKHSFIFWLFELNLRNIDIFTFLSWMFARCSSWHCGHARVGLQETKKCKLVSTSTFCSGFYLLTSISRFNLL